MVGSYRKKKLWIWLRIVLLGATCFGLIEGDNRYGSFARVLLKNWRRKTEVKTPPDSRLFAPLPEDVESSYSPPQVIVNRGYNVEVHHVTTDDGYILELHRIPSTKSTKVVFLQHGVLESSGTWLVNPSARSLAIILAAKGYDVWLGNARGNRFSRSHVNLNTKSSAFWNFSWDQLGKYDIPAAINYILDKTGEKKLSYVGHSLGCGMFFIAMVTNPELNSKIEIMVALAPLSSFANYAVFLRTITWAVQPVELFLKLLGTRQLLDIVGFRRFVVKLACELTYSQARICRSILNIFTGPNRQNLDLTLMPSVDSNLFQGTSVAVIAQFAQNYNAGDVFQAYDYGKSGNLQKYGTTTPYVYDLRKVTAPVYVFSGGNDYIVTPKDVDWLLTQLGNLKGSTRLSDYNHIDFIWGTDVKERVYNDVLSLLPSP